MLRKLGRETGLCDKRQRHRTDPWRVTLKPNMRTVLGPGDGYPVWRLTSRGAGRAGL